MTVHTLETPLGVCEIVHDFISQDTERYLLQRLDDLTSSGAGGTQGWIDLNGRRSMYLGGAVVQSGALLPRPFPSWMSGSFPDVLGSIAALGKYDQFKGNGNAPPAPNHCLVNEYLPGQGIAHHTDGPAYSPLTSTLSLGSHTILDVRKPQQAGQQEESDSISISILLPARSLFMLPSPMYECVHGIEARNFDTIDQLRSCVNWQDYWSHVNDENKRRIVEDADGWERTKRISLTCRRVPNVKKGIKIG